jgi:phage protein D
MATWSKNFLLEFIELFRREECLWKVKSKDYYNRSKKDASYRTLIGKVQEVESDATRDTVVKKINNLRSAFRKEHKKVLKSQVSDAGAEKTYAPRLWYYNQLLFLCNQEALHSSTSIMQEEEENSEVHLLLLFNFTLPLHLIDIVCVQYAPSKLTVKGF